MDKDQNQHMNEQAEGSQEGLNEDLTVELDLNEMNEAAETTGSNAEMDRLRSEVEEHQQRLLRVQADYDNFRKRTQREKEELGKYASAKLIGELLPVFDNFGRAMSAGMPEGDQSSFIKGVEMIYRQFEGILKAEGLTPMETVGQPFNPEFHQAVMQVETDEYEEGIVVEELQKGYMLKDKVLRPAMVKVSG